MNTVAGKVRLSMKVACPRRSEASSFRFTEVPTKVPVVSVTAIYATPATSATAATMLW